MFWTALVLVLPNARAGAAQVVGRPIRLPPAAVATWQELQRRDAFLPKSQRVPVPAPAAGSSLLPGQTPGPGEPPRAPEMPREEAGQGPARPLDLSGTATAFAAPLMTTGFQGICATTQFPPDVNGAVGLSRVVTMLNWCVTVQDKSDGSVLSTMSLDAFWSLLSGTPYDPRLIFDQGSQRWIASAGADPRLSTSSVFFAISATDDPAVGAHAGEGPVPEISETRRS